MMIFVVLFAHWVADFVFQTDAQAKGKSQHIHWLAAHVLSYTLCLAPFGPRFAVVNGLSHFVIDYFTSKLSRYFYQKGQTHNFFVVIGFDQFLHTAILILTMPLIGW